MYIYNLKGKLKTALVAGGVLFILGGVLMEIGLIEKMNAAEGEKWKIPTEAPLWNASVSLYGDGDFGVLKSQVLGMLTEGQRQGTFDVVAITQEEVEGILLEAAEDLRKLPGYYRMIESYRYTLQGHKLDVWFEYLNEPEKLFAGMAVADEALGTLINDAMDDYEKVLAIHDYLIDRAAYPTDFDAEDEDLQSIYGALVEGMAVCSGYTDAFNYMAGKAGVESIIVVGVAGGIDHSWNMVKLEGDWYHVDVTWNDLVDEEGPRAMGYNYLNVTSREIAKNHEFDLTKYPVASEDALNYYVVNDLIVHDEAQAIDQLNQLFLEGRKVMEVKFGYDVEDDDIQKILEKSALNGRAIRVLLDEAMRVLRVTYGDEDE